MVVGNGRSCARLRGWSSPGACIARHGRCGSGRIASAARAAMMISDRTRIVVTMVGMVVDPAGYTAYLGIWIMRTACLSAPRPRMPVKVSPCLREGLRRSSGASRPSGDLQDSPCPFSGVPWRILTRLTLRQTICLGIPMDPKKTNAITDAWVNEWIEATYPPLTFWQTVRLICGWPQRGNTSPAGKKD
jgi:hypothetical protein